MQAFYRRSLCGPTSTHRCWVGHAAFVANVGHARHSRRSIDRTSKGPAPHSDAQRSGSGVVSDALGQLGGAGEGQDGVPSYQRASRLVGGIQGVAAAFARTCPGVRADEPRSFTHLEITRVLELIGADRWSTDLALKYGIRDGFHCPIGKRWILTYWSPQVLDLSDEVRAILFMGATFACIRLQNSRRGITAMGDGAALTAPELSVLRALSLGLRLGDIAEQLELKEETIRSHLKRAEGKLDVHDRCHAVAQAIRESLIL